MSYSTDPVELQVEFEDMVIVEKEVSVGGVTDHTQLTGRDTANQHPISAIADLQTTLDNKQDKSALETDVEALGFTKNTGTYSKPSGGIPKTDLASDVQTSLNKADSALQEHQSLEAYRLISDSYSKNETDSRAENICNVALIGYRQISDSYSRSETDDRCIQLIDKYVDDYSLKDAVKTVNNIKPDSNGNVTIEGGTGQDGTTFTPSVSSDGTLSWTNDGGKDNPTPVNIKGEKGDTGATGADGTSVTVTSVSESTKDGGSNVVRFSDGKTVTIKNGSKGSQGATGATGATGADGYTPVKGTDYWTAADKTEMVDDVLAALPTWTGGSY